MPIGKPFKIMLCLLFALSLSGLLNACGPVSNRTPVTENPSYASASTPPEPQKQANGTLYQIRLDNEESLFVDSLGSLVYQGKNVRPHYDMRTGELRYLSQPRYIDSGKQNEFGYPIDIPFCETLLDTSGKVAIPESAYQYNNFFGDFGVRSSIDGSGAYQSELFRVSTGETIKKGISYVAATAGNIVLHNMDNNTTYRMNLDGSISDPITIPGYDTDSGYWVYYSNDTESAETLYGLDSPDWKTILPMEYESIQVAGDYALTWKEGHGQAIQLPDGEILFESDKQIQYFDGQTFILRSPSDSEVMLANRGGTLLSEGWQSIYSTASASGVFIAYGQDDRCALLDKSGEILWQGVECNINEAGSGTFSVNWYNRPEEERPYDSCLISRDGTVLVPEGRYAFIYGFYQASNSSGYYYSLAQRLAPKGVRVYDLLDAQGEIVLSGMNNITEGDGEFFAVCKGFSVGLVDAKGNWVFKTSVFQTANDE